ncbi:LUD domain-containing protein [Solirubrobacter sp. CPCC 204708]|uniref:Lactate utilization protein n=1 Tax=Solirubrobacter deserti TaxID=2282478 RepID=A0ABT4RLG5_9ACTN|nr:LUD domain-containing protein [Solirubrobacter deserti]MBE2320465.1 LUD domain-containing protein [Solirubrobacter deserti]MDA0139344.1 lactate utilization protein [Solirubrobacter deserti]
MNRKAFLARLEARLADAAPPATAHPPAPAPDAVPRVRFPPDERALEVRFGEALTAIRGRLVPLDELLSALAQVRTAVVTTDALALPDHIERLPLDQAERADAGVTLARAACAATGTVLLAPSERETRLASLLPPLHVVAVPRDVLVETPGDVLRDLPRFFPDGLPSAFSLASGPSKSADIDAVVTYGVHGPLAVLAVIL